MELNTRLGRAADDCFVVSVIAACGLFVSVLVFVVPNAYSNIELHAFEVVASVAAIGTSIMVSFTLSKLAAFEFEKHVDRVQHRVRYRGEKDWMFRQFNRIPRIAMKYD